MIGRRCQWLKKIFGLKISTMNLKSSGAMAFGSFAFA
jgi:hypothetical protein